MTERLAPSLMIIAGEVSGDIHATKLVRAIKARCPSATFFGTGGHEMASEGVEILQDIREMAVMGFSEVIRRYPFFKALFRRMLAEADSRKPNAVILVDYPGFNLRLAKKLHARGIKVIYYICPQVWAWNRGRIPSMAASLDRLITIFPFEPQHFEGTGLKTDYAGHPLVADIKKVLESPEAALPWTSDCRIALLPGSRQHEIERILPVILEAAEMIRQSKPEASFILPTPSAEITELVNSMLPGPGMPLKIEVLEGSAREVLRQASAAIVASGTATVETALLGCPMVVVYRVSLLTYLLARMLVRIDNIAMVNIIAGKTICPELLQHEATPERISEALLPLLDDSPERSQMLRDLADVKAKLGEGDAEAKAAEAILEEINTAADDIPKAG